MRWIEPLRRALRRVDVRLVGTLLVLYAPLVAGVLFVLYGFAADELLELVDSDTEMRLAEVAHALETTPAAERHAELARLADLTARGEGAALALRDSAQRLVPESSRAAGSAPVRSAERSWLDAVRLGGDTWLRYTRRLPSGEQLELTVPLRTFVHERDELERGFWISLALGLALVALASPLASRRALAPLRSATRATERVDLARLDARLPVRGTRDDVDRHAAAVNHVLDRLEAGFARISAFSHDAAHELRTPVNRILNGAELALLDAKDDDPSRAALEMIRGSAEQLARLIDGLLLLARGSEGTLPETSPLGLRELCDTLREIYGPVCEERSVSLAFEPADATVRGDRTLLLRAIANLLDNALRHTPAGGTIGVAASFQDGTVTIRVTDTGPGIAEEDRERVFGRFVRLEAGRTGLGAGLGLPIARMIARAHGGDLVAEPAPTGGARFALRLPADPSAGAQT
jgi:two-component system, OmpR family, heavy metal sensor histidine kinase CusS